MTREERAREAVAQAMASKHWAGLVREGKDDDWGVIKSREAIAACLAFADAEAMRERAADLFQKAIEDGYPAPAEKVDQCEHGQFGWEDCIACYDVALLAAVDEVRNLSVTGEVGRG